jgi:NADH-quinone oxidoreductase subunit H
MTSFFQNLGMSYEAAWFTATIAGILLIALPLMLAVAMTSLPIRPDKMVGMQA